MNRAQIQLLVHPLGLLLDALLLQLSYLDGTLTLMNVVRLLPLEAANAIHLVVADVWIVLPFHFHILVLVNGLDGIITLGRLLLLAMADPELADLAPVLAEMVGLARRA